VPGNDILVVGELRLLVWRGELEAARRLHAALPAGFVLGRWMNATFFEPDPGGLEADLAAIEAMWLRPSDGPPRIRQALLFHQLHVDGALARGEIDRALGHLERAVALGLIDVSWMRRCPLLAPLRELPRFAGLLADVDLRAGAVQKLLSTSGR
jgi:hypothetical protein